MNRLTMTVFALAALAAPVSVAHAGRNLDFPPVTVGAIEISGGGTTNPQTGAVRAGGQFHALSDITAGPLAGLRAGDGVRWEVDQFLPSSLFKCVGAEVAQTVTASPNTVVAKVLFFTRGDGNQASFSANVFISTDDEDPLQPGVQNIWIQGVGCAEAQVTIR
jgi:hypothetical protein